MKHAITGTNHAILTKHTKVKHEKRPVSNLKKYPDGRFEQTYTKFIEIFVPSNNFFIGKKA